MADKNVVSDSNVISTKRKADDTVNVNAKKQKLKQTAPIQWPYNIGHVQALHDYTNPKPIPTTPISTSEHKTPPRREIAKQSTEKPKKLNPHRYIRKRDKNKAKTANGSQTPSYVDWDSDASIFDLAPEISALCKRKRRLSCDVPNTQRTEYKAHEKGVNRIKWSRGEGQLLASCSMDATASIWSPFSSTKRVVHLTCHEAAVKDLGWSHDNRHLFTASYDKTVKYTDVETATVVQSFKHKQFITCLQPHPTQTDLFIAGGAKSGIVCWDLRSHSVAVEYKSVMGQVQSMEFIDNGNAFVSSSDVTRRNCVDKAVRVFDFNTGSILSNQVYLEAFTCTRVRAHPTEKQFLMQSNGNYIAIFSSTKYKLNKYKRYQAHNVSGYPIGFDISPDGTLVVSGCTHGNLVFYDYVTSRVLRKFKAHKRPCIDVAFHPIVPSLVASCDWAGGITLWQ